MLLAENLCLGSGTLIVVVECQVQRHLCIGAFCHPWFFSTFLFEVRHTVTREFLRFWLLELCSTVQAGFFLSISRLVLPVL